MGVIVRGNKSTGGTSLADGGVIYADELDVDIDTAYSEINGNLDDDNIKSAANIDPGKIGDYAASDAEFITAASPGDSSSTSKPTTLEGELERIRYVIERAHIGIDATRVDGSGTATTAWFDIPYRPVNLVFNPEFAFHTAGTPNAPDGWALEGTPGTVELEAMAASAGPGKALRIVAAGATDEGIKYTLAGPRAGARYLFVVRCKATSGTAKIVTTGADSASSFRNVTITTTSATYVTKAFVVQADASANSLVVKLMAAADTDDVSFASCHGYECASDAIVAGQNYTASASSTTDTTGHYVVGSDTSSGLSVAVIPPGPGYQIHVRGKMQVSQDSGTNPTIVCKLKENGTEVDSANVSTFGTGVRACPAFYYVNTAPTPGTTYTYTMTGRSVGAASAYSLNDAAVADETPKTSLSVTLVKA